MKKTMFILSATLIMAACNNDSKTATDPGTTDTSGNTKSSTAPVLDSATKAANMMAYGTPGAMHKMMAGWDGKWTATIKFWVKPELPPDSIMTNSVNKMINNGLIQYSTHDGNWAGMPFNGVSQTGYDNHREVFWSTWYDNFGSGIVYMEGKWDDATKTISMKGKTTDPESKMQLDLRETLKVVDENTQFMEQFITHDGKEMKAMEITFRRKK